jgi:hypothetical protein
MHSNGLSETIDRIQAGTSPDAALAEFVDAFDLALTDGVRFAMLEKAPALTGDERLDALEQILIRRDHNRLRRRSSDILGR